MDGIVIICFDQEYINIFARFSLITVKDSRNFEIWRVQCRRSRQDLFNGIKIVSNGPNLASFRLVESSELRWDLGSWI